MNDSLQEVMTAAVEGAARKAAAEAPPRPAPRLRAVAVSDTAEPAAKPMPAAGDMVFADDNGKLGRSGLRLAFWVCGFNEALRERQRKGERLSEREDSLLTLSHKDFAGIRHLVIAMALERLHVVVNAPDLQPGATSEARPGATSEARPGATSEARPGAMEIFALEALRNLSERANTLLREDGTETALSLFGDVTSVHEPLAIFQLVFSTAVGLVESFDRFVHPEAKLLARLGEALGTEVERI